MSLNAIHLRKLLKIMFLDRKGQISEIRKDIRGDIKKQSDENGSGGDFYGPFWADAKGHVFENLDLRESVKRRISANLKRANLYPQLCDGFLLWWNQRRRWTNRPFTKGTYLKKNVNFSDLDAVVKINNILSAQDGNRDDHFVYPYFSPKPVLTDESARLGLWMLNQAFPDIEFAELRILDIIRGQTFSIDRNPLIGNEGENFRRRYLDILALRDKLREDY